MGAGRGEVCARGSVTIPVSHLPSWSLQEALAASLVSWQSLSEKTEQVNLMGLVGFSGRVVCFISFLPGRDLWINQFLHDPEEAKACLLAQV